MSEQNFTEQLESRLAAVSETDAAQKRLSANPLQQSYVLLLDDGDAITISLEPHATSLTVESDGNGDGTQFGTTTISLSKDVLENILEGDFLSTYYLDGTIEIRGLQPAWLLLGYLFGINHDLQLQAD